MRLHFLHKAERQAVQRGELSADGATVRFSVTSKPSMPGIKGGQGRSGAEIEQAADHTMAALFILGLVVVIAVAVRACC